MGTLEAARADLINMRALADPSGHVGLIDDTNCPQEWCKPVNDALLEAEKAGDVEIVYRLQEGNCNHCVDTGGVTVFRFKDANPAGLDAATAAATSVLLGA